MAYIQFLGAAGTVTGSKHLINTSGDLSGKNGTQVLVDCGLFQGPRAESRHRNRDFPFPPKQIDAVVLSHAHIDHCGNLPNLVRQGFTGPIYCTPATRDLMAIMLADSAKIQAEEAALAPRVDECSTALLYSRKEVEQTLMQCVSVPYETPHAIAAGMRCQFHDAGHLLGSAIVSVACEIHGATRTISTKAGQIQWQLKGITHMEEGLSDDPLRAVMIELMTGQMPLSGDASPSEEDAATAAS